MSTTQTSGSSAPPLLPDAEKFDGTNYSEWQETILMACRLRGARGYLEGTIPQPTAATTTTTTTPATGTAQGTTQQTATPAADTRWTSATPSFEEWDARDAWCMIAVRQNVKNPIGLGVKLDGSAAEAWSSLESRYKQNSDLARVYAQRELRSLKMNEGDHFPTHLALLHTKHSRANAVGASISDNDFKEIILTSLPPSWDVIIAALPVTSSSVDTVIRLEMHWSRINRGGAVTAPGTSATALKASTGFIKICSNPVCKRRGHLISDCYWKGGGKEGQFPPGFGQRGQYRGNGSNAAVPATDVKEKSLMAAAPSTTAEPIERVMALSASTRCLQDFLDSIDIKQSINIICEDDLDNATNATITNDVNNAPKEVIGVPDGDLGTEIVYSMLASASVVDSVPETYLDSGASKNCFINETDFSTYTKFDTPVLGQPANRDAKFSIHGYGNVHKRYRSKDHRVQFQFENALHTPDFAANLVSVSHFDDRDISILFGKGRATFFDHQEKKFLEAEKRGGMYPLNEVGPDGEPLKVIAMPAKSREKPVPFHQWHRRFCHIGEKKLKELISKSLVDGLQVKTDGATPPGRCEDCIYGKQTNRPYDEVVTPETEVLGRVHGDLWGKSRVASVGGALYVLILTDGASSYRKEYFFSEKTGENVLEALKQYKAEAELHTGKKLKILRFDMGREFLTRALEAWCKENGIIIETPAPYAHSANGVAERTNRTVFERVRCVRCDSGLPAKYWADIVAAVIYVLNLTPSSRHPGQIPAERWFGTRQDVSHLRPIGADAYAKIPKEINPSKLDTVSIKYTLIGYYGREAYKLLDRATGLVIKARNVDFEEGDGHRTSVHNDPLHDEPIFHDDDMDDTENNVPTAPHVVPPSPNAQQPPPAQPVADPYPIAPRHRPTDPHNHRDRSTAGHQAPQNAEPVLPQAPPPPRRSGRKITPTAASEAVEESAQREQEAKENGEDWANDWKHGKAHLASPTYDLHADHAAFHSAHMANFQADLDSYITLLAKSDPQLRVPLSYTEAMQESDAWLPPMEDEMAMMRARGVFSTVPRPPNRKVIGLKWVYGYKFDGAGNITRRKARLVAQGFHQIPGVDFDQTYASVARLESIRMCLAITAHLGLLVLEGHCCAWQYDLLLQVHF